MCVASLQVCLSSVKYTLHAHTLHAQHTLHAHNRKHMHASRHVHSTRARHATHPLHTWLLHRGALLQLCHTTERHVLGGGGRDNRAEQTRAAHYANTPTFSLTHTNLSLSSLDPCRYCMQALFNHSRMSTHRGCATAAVPYRETRPWWRRTRRSHSACAAWGARRK